MSNFEIDKMGALELGAFKDKVINSLLTTGEKSALYEAINARELVLSREAAIIDDSDQASYDNEDFFR